MSTHDGTGLPGYARLLLVLLLPPRDRETWIGDLEEGYRRRVRDAGQRSARAWLRRQMVRTPGPALGMRWRARWIRMDLRFAVRSLLKSPGFTAIAVLTLAMAMAVNTAIFSIASGIFLADLPMEEPDRIAFIWGRDDATAATLQPVSKGTYRDVVEGLETAERVGAMEQGDRVLTGMGDPVRLGVAAITPHFLDIWGLPSQRGRGFAGSDVAPGAEAVVLVSHGFWSRSMGEDPDALGRTLTLDGAPHTIVGIVPSEMEFGGLSGIDVWLPLRIDAQALADRMERSLLVTARLAPGASFDQLQAEVAARWAAVAEAYPQESRNWTVEARSTRDSLVNEAAKTVMLLLGLIVGIVLLIACVNTANMLLARGARRSRELAVRAALGAGRGAILRPLAAESLLLSLTATALGIIASALLLGGLADLTREVDAMFTMARIDGRVLGFSALLAMLAPLVFGLLPAIRVSRTEPGLDLGERSAGSGRRLGRIRSTLVGAQVALAMVALVVGGVLVRSGIHMQQMDAEYRRDGILTASILRPSAIQDADDTFFGEFMDNVEALPGVSGAALVSELPRRGAALRRIEVEGVGPSEDRRRVYETVVTPGYLRVMEIPLLEGRTFDRGDGADGVPVAVVSRAMAETLWPGRTALGRRFRTGDSGSPWLQVVGVAADVKFRSDLTTASPHFYRPLAQAPRAAVSVVARVGGEPQAWADPVREAVWSVDPNQPVEAVVSLGAAEFQDLSVSWAVFGLFVLFAVFALIMAAAGIYGVISYSVASRTPEFGIRLALGASAGRVRAMVLRQGIGVVLAGAAVGLVGAWIAAGLMERMVVGMSPRDPLTFALVPVLLLLVALVANWVPALRATRVDPVRALREE
ncbi:MAG: ABC transporter permease [Gemmatimonadota bacterium]